jgi:uncharacterized membrane protein YcaP (DUF421 family)
MHESWFQDSWQHMFSLGLPWIEKILRPTLVYVFLIIGLRIAGKRGLASLNSFDLVVLLCISNTVQNAIIGEDNSITGGIIGASTLLAVNYLTVRFFFEHPKLDEVVEGKMTLLMEGGKIIERNLKSEFITHNELEVAAHKQGFRSLEEVERAELEPGGALAFFAKKPTPEERREVGLMQRLDEISKQLKELKEKVEQR